MTKEHCDKCDKVLTERDPHVGLLTGDVGSFAFTLKVIAFREHDTDRPIDLCAGCRRELMQHRGLKIYETVPADAPELLAALKDYHAATEAIFANTDGNVSGTIPAALALTYVGAKEQAFKAIAKAEGQ